MRLRPWLPAKKNTNKLDLNMAAQVNDLRRSILCFKSVDVQYG